MRFLNFNVKLAFFMLVAFLPLSWITVYGVGDSSIKLFHLTIIPLLICCFYNSFRNKIVVFVKENRFIMSCFLLLMTMNFVSMSINSLVIPHASIYVIKNLAYFFFFTLLGGMCLSLFNLENTPKLLTQSAFICVCTFIVIASIGFKATGGNFLADMLKFFISGDINGLRHDLYKTLFNGGTYGKDADFATALINTIIGSFIFVHFLSLYALRTSKSRLQKGLNIFSLIFSFFFVVSSISRSNIIAIGFGYMIYWGLEIVYNNNVKKVVSLVSSVLVLIAVMIVFGNKMQDAVSNMSDMYQARFGDLDENIRWQLNAEAIETFTSNAKSFIFGSGSGALLSNGKSVHNFIIGSAYQAGIFGLILSSLFYFTILSSLLRFAPLLSKYKFAFILAAVMALPLIRQMESGDAGSLTLQEWFCLAFFLSFVINKKLSVENSENYVSAVILTYKKPGTLVRV